MEPTKANSKVGEELQPMDHESMRLRPIHQDIQPNPHWFSVLLDGFNLNSLAYWVVTGCPWTPSGNHIMVLIQVKWLVCVDWSLVLAFCQGTMPIVSPSV